jgi:hypothetical protein
VFALSIPVAAFAPYAAVALWLLTFPLRILVPRFVGGTSAPID